LVTEQQITNQCAVTCLMDKKDIISYLTTYMVRPS
jgi:hypothetical protein